MNTVRLLRLSMPKDEWSKEEREIWYEAQKPAGLLDEGGCRARHAARSNTSIEEGYGRWKTWDRAQDDVDPQTSHRDRIVPARVRAFAAELEKANAPVTVLGRLIALKLMAEILNPGRDFSWIYRIASGIRSNSKPTTLKRQRLVPIGQLWSLGHHLMRCAGKEVTPSDRATTYQDGLLIALVSARPLRLANLTAVEMGRTLVRQGGSWWIHIPAQEVKTRVPIDLPWPDALLSQLEVYLSEHRQWLLKANFSREIVTPSRLWLTVHGRPMSKQTVYRRIVNRTREAFGRSINPHLFRDCAVTSIAIEDPAHVRTAAPLLQHRSFSTTEKYYNQALSIEAARSMQSRILALRRGTSE